jgi:hypothetical protein
METPADLMEALVEKAEAYGKTTYELSTLKALETTTIVLGSLVAQLSVFILIFLFVFVLSIGVALLLGEVLGKIYYGFFVVAAGYLIAGLVLHLFRHAWIKKPISDLIIAHTFQ